MTKQIVTLAEWDAASTEQRAEWLKDGHILTSTDAERLRLRYQPRIVAESETHCRHAIWLVKPCVRCGRE